jgi:glycerate kinase
LVAQLDAALKQWADVVEPAVGRQVRDVPGSGAAGGLGAGLIAFTNHTLKRGVDVVVQAVGLAEQVALADWVFTGEGGIDSQTMHGKTPWGVAQVAAKAGVPVVMFGGRITADAGVLLEKDAVALVPIVRSIESLEDALQNGPENLAAAAEMTVRLLAAR